MDANLTTFNEIIEKVLDHEGGYVNDPTDRGGETNFGIAKRFYPDVDIKNLTREEAKKIYHQDYWRPAKCDEVSPKLRHIYFDMCVNFGRSGAVKVLQRAANAKGAGLIVDGGIGPKTINAIADVEHERVKAYRVLKFAKIVLNKPEQEKFWFGWYKRATEV
jgi:lysozyme family protein|tara:strand:- start:544 stop:1029 length:486 start_codon:yes stop_codon:yes gene_type:complete